MKQRSDQAWNPPPVGFIKLNIDGARDPASGDASAAAVTRDDIGLWYGVEETLRNAVLCRQNFGQSMMDSIWREIIIGSIL